MIAFIRVPNAAPPIPTDLANRPCQTFDDYKPCPVCGCLVLNVFITDDFGWVCEHCTSLYDDPQTWLMVDRCATSIRRELADAGLYPHQLDSSDGEVCRALLSAMSILRRCEPRLLARLQAEAR